LPDLAENVKIIVEIVDGVEDGGSDLSAFEEVVEVGPAEVPTGVAGTGLVQGPPVLGVLDVLDGEPPPAGEKRPVPGVSRREDAIEKVHPPVDSLQDVLDVPHAHQVTGLVLRQEGAAPFEDLEKLGLGLAQAEAPERIAVEVHLQEVGDAFFPLVPKYPSLADPPQVLDGFTGFEMPLGAGRPARRPAHGFLHRFHGRGVGWERVQAHHDVSPQLPLDVHDVLRGQEDFRSIEVGREPDPVLADLDEG